MRKREGFGLIETVVGVAIVSLVLFGLAEIGRFSLLAVDEANLRIRAGFIAEEGMEVVRLLRDSSWDDEILPLVLDTDYWLVISQGIGGKWVATTTPAAPIDGIFDRRARLSSVCRDSSDAIVECPGAYTDSHTRRVTISVSWSSRGRTTSLAIPSYITNLFDN